MIQKVLQIIVIIGIVTITLWGIYRFIFYSIDFEGLDKSCEKCPQCREFLYVEYGKYANMYRCKHCRFEGLREPIMYGVIQSAQYRKERVIGYLRKWGDK